MVNVSLFKSNKDKTENLSTIEAFNVWNILRSRYISIETYQFFRNFIHDKDFTLLVDQHLADFHNQVTTMEGLAKSYKVKVPTRPPAEIKISTQLDTVTDKYIHKKLYNDLISELTVLADAVISSTTNDRLRSHLNSFLMNHLKNYEQLYKFGKLKAWTEVEPAFKTGRSTLKEMVSVSEAYHLWEHLSYRYDQLELTKIYKEFVHDLDFKVILDRGSSTLDSQIKILEKESAKYEVPLPERPPASMPIIIDPEVMSDLFAYRTIFTGMQSAMRLHIRAVVETIRNDPLRKIFFEFLEIELNLYDKYVVYGKAKGWLHVVPIFKMS